MRTARKTPPGARPNRNDTARFAGQASSPGPSFGLVARGGRRRPSQRNGRHVRTFGSGPYKTPLTGRLPLFLPSLPHTDRNARNPGLDLSVAAGMRSRAIRKADPLSLFGPEAALPAGLRYATDLLSPEEERALVERFAELPFKTFEFQGFLGKRRVISFGWRYDFNLMRVERTEVMPDFLWPLRERAARFAGLEPAALQHVLLTE